MDEVVNIHLAQQTIKTTRDFIVTSCLHELESATMHSRSLRNTQVYAPVLCAFAILDQIGSCYINGAIAAHPNEGSGIHHALYYFCGMPAMSEEVKALYAFRNGLIHDGSFTNQSRRTGQWYLFRYDNKLTAPVAMPKIPWDGTAASFRDETTTKINMRVFTNTVLTGLGNLRRMFQDHRPDIQIKYTREDIIHKFLLW